jgi:hypothetical protein
MPCLRRASSKTYLGLLARTLQGFALQTQTLIPPGARPRPTLVLHNIYTDRANTMIQVPEITLTPLDVLRAIPGVLGLIGFVYWLRAKTILDYYLEGRWTGNLVDVEDPNFVIQCTLYLFRDRHHCTGLLYYEVRSQKHLVAHGLDRLLQYDDKDLFPRSWTPSFERVIHATAQDGILNDAPYVYNYDFNIKKRWFKSCMGARTTIVHKDRTLTGLWHQP